MDRLIQLIIFLLITTLCACKSGSAPKSYQSPAKADASFVRDTGFSAVKPVNDASAFAASLKSCVLAKVAVESCTLAQLPPLGWEYSESDVTAVMSRALVSQEWMGQRLHEQLQLMPAEIFLLMRNVTAVVVAENVSPSFYSPITGAIYLDPYLLWQSAAEKASLNRSVLAPASPWQFRAWWRYVRDGDFAYGKDSDWQLAERPSAKLLLPLTATLFHELAHASDYFPPQHLNELPIDTRMADAALAMWGQRPSDGLYQMAPLQSELLFRLVGALYEGEAPEPTDLRLQAAQVAAAFAMDGASDDYAYVSQYEDAAMLFEEIMMRRHFNLQRDVAYLQAPNNDLENCDAYKVVWGVRNRVGDPRVRQRAQYIAEHLLPEVDWNAFFAALPEPQPLPVGSGWCASVKMD